jgi:SnoaL-like protein
MSNSPIDQVLEALDALDLDGAVSLFTADGRLMTADGRRAEGTEAIRALLADWFAQLRSTAHTLTASWQLDGVWIAEVDAAYELTDYLKMSGVPRAFILRTGDDGITDMRVYGAHERPLSEHRTGEEGFFIGRWIAPL